jgi:hypothetical protein
MPSTFERSQGEIKKWKSRAVTLLFTYLPFIRSSPTLIKYEHSSIGPNTTHRIVRELNSRADELILFPHGNKLFFGGKEIHSEALIWVFLSLYILQYSGDRKTQLQRSEELGRGCTCHACHAGNFGEVTFSSPAFLKLFAVCCSRPLFAFYSPGESIFFDVFAQVLL